MISKMVVQRVEGLKRQQVFAFIRQQFSDHFGADLIDDTPELYAVYGSDGAVQAAFGLNRDPGTFFCRHYIGDVSSALDQAYPDSKLTPNRRTVELSHLCVKKPATLCRLVVPLAEFLLQEADYLTCTVTQCIAQLFERKHLTSHRLGDAALQQLPETLRSGWGDYYAHQPTVVLGSLSEAWQTLSPTPAFKEELKLSA